MELQGNRLKEKWELYSSSAQGCLWGCSEQMWSPSFDNIWELFGWAPHTARSDNSQQWVSSRAMTCSPFVQTPWKTTWFMWKW